MHTVIKITANPELTPLQQNRENSSKEVISQHKSLKSASKECDRLNETLYTTEGVRTQWGTYYEIESE